MEKLDIDGEYLSLIQYLYWNKKRYMINVDGLSPEIHIKRWVQQGYVLSPCLFNMYTYNIFGAITNKGIHIGETKIHKLFYSYETVLYIWHIRHTECIFKVI